MLHTQYTNEASALQVGFGRVAARLPSSVAQEFKNVESSLGIETAKQPSYPPLVTKVGQFPVWATLGVVLAFSIAIPVGGQPGPRCENL